ncbi:apolipophorin-3-like [Anticarsia gemmatalis]|uniref:apolipophorin-3-like n=1 Tax=Anticarsia gemmatalis TaxID=129554 RepID=UPI003F762D58
MAAKLLVLFACIALSQAGLVRRDAPASSPLQDIEKHAGEFQKTVSEQFQSLVNSKNTQELNKALKDGSESVLQQLSAFSNTLQKALGDANGKAKTAIEETRQKIETAAADLRKAHPEVEQQASALREKLQAAVQNTVQETQKLAKEVASNVDATNQKLAPQLKQAYDDLVKNVQDVQKKLHDAATKQ